MTAVEVRSAGPAPQLDIVSSPEVARARAERIRQGIHTYLETLAEIALAWERRDWQVLGYPSWQAYVDGEFGADRLKMPVEHRQKAVTELRLSGMSQRAIGTVLGVDQATVKRDLDAAGDVGPAAVRGADGKTYASTRPTPARPAPAEGGPGPDEQVWIAAARKGIQAHALRSKTSTRCDRSTRTGLTLTAGQARDRHHATWCKSCWPQQATAAAAVDAVEADPLAGVGDQYEPDPHKRIAAVAALDPAYVRPVLPDPTPETAAGEPSQPADGADTACPPDHVGDAAPAPAPPASSPASGAGVTPAPGGLTLAQVARLRAAFTHARAAARSDEARVYQVPYSSTSPVLARPPAVDMADLQWWPDGEIHIRYLQHGGNYCEASSEFFAGDVDQALDLLCALRLLPAHLSTAYADGVRAGMRAGDAIDGKTGDR
ncbi:hypothetical protein CSH63_32990 [Micromonospora tulbaghiae]|uniref:Uncharacterized protein n=1 Tax=Micromonospora tulbaghiae TaxID=479978 RepID=A0A386WVP7_9ACTN|nr:hypothetical protein [Micromonospora tulbaghiae]AYF32172.1 hypothetical protein CSH63_32990 [Micromonospora tulbaghiae]